MTDQKEIERIKRIRNQQITVRYDPDEKKARYNKISVQRRQGTKVTTRSVLKDIPNKVWWSLIGGMIGLVFTLILLRLPGAPEYALYIGLAGVVFGLVVGFVLGKQRDSGKEDWGPKGGRR
ncbi:MAG TPA: hypothetical protein VFF59_00070 [Anaerolineae bacterium]|nr:hypothetical protein [Anaerolineae bacterium]